MIVTYPLEAVWPKIEHRVSLLLLRYSESLEYEIHDVYRACADKRAFIFNCDEDDSFAICKVLVRNDEKILFIWIAYGECGKRDRNTAFLKDIARSVGAVKMEMESPRFGFDRMPGWRRKITTYQAEV